MMTKPISAMDTAAEFAPSAANFSTLKFALLCMEASTTSTGQITESVGGMVLKGTSSTQIINNANGTLNVATGAPAVQALSSIVSGTMPVQGTKSLLVIHVGSVANSSGSIVIGKPAAPASGDSALRFGGTAAQAPTLSGLGSAGGNSLVTAGAAMAAGIGTIGVGPMQLHAVSVVPGSATGFKGYDYDGTTFGTPFTTDLSGVSGVTTVTTPNLINMGSGISPGGLFIFHFNGAIPSADSMKAGLIWMFDRFVASQEKVLPPWWAELT